VASAARLLGAASRPGSVTPSQPVPRSVVGGAAEGGHHLHAARLLVVASLVLRPLVEDAVDPYGGTYDGPNSEAPSAQVA
jgi:hypothetical protein